MFLPVAGMFTVQNSQARYMNIQYSLHHTISISAWSVRSKGGVVLIGVVCLLRHFR
jgi:hypothetical protein